jgi:transcription initiation factor IIE alpha subunit
MKTMKLLLIAILVISTLPVFAQEKAGKKDTTKHPVWYSCSMHPEEGSNKPGKCPKCGMRLTQTTKEAMKNSPSTIYTCTMHPTITSDKPGKCSACGKDLTASQKEQRAQDIMANFSCPMHPTETSDKPGICSKCGMKLTASKN